MLTNGMAYKMIQNNFNKKKKIEWQKRNENKENVRFSKEK